jgi:hypothetical protein
MTGVPISGTSGTVTRQITSGREVTLVLDSGEIRIARWPDPAGPPELEGMWLAATVRSHPEGPSRRVEIGPKDGSARWVLGTSFRPGAQLVAGASLGTPVADGAGIVGLPILQGGVEIARLPAGGATVLREGKARWCLRIVAVSLPRPPRPGAANEFQEPRVDVYARRLTGKQERCAAGGQVGRD